MERKLAIYLETTMFNFPFADDAPDKKKATVALFDEIKAGKYIPYTSAYVVDELLDAEEPKQSYMIQLIKITVPMHCILQQQRLMV